MRALFLELEAFPVRLEAWLSSRSDECLRRRPSPGSFAPVEHLWHLADLEAEGYALRARRLLDEASPELVDFDGTTVARERNYLRKDPLEALQWFHAARHELIQLFEALPPDAWLRDGIQAGVGPVRLGDLPIRMVEHDAEHWQELQAIP